MAFNDNFIDDLKAKLDIVEVIGRDVRLSRDGSNYKGLCPFHNEKTPSFKVSGQKQIFNCFGCGEKGDVIRFIERFYNLTFLEAVDKLCDDYNIPKPEYGSRPVIDYDKYYEINRKAARFFNNQLTQTKNPGLAYFRKRKISDATIIKFGLGYAPDSWSALYTYLRKEGISEDDMLKLGLVSKGKNGCYDRFRGRVIFPIFNVSGKVIGFGGRTLGDDTPKYLNSSESEIFLKKNNLYALNFTKGDVAAQDKIILVEGYMDVISLYQNGVKNVAASLGTALTENQARLIHRYTDNVVLSYDSDAAGVKAADRAIDVIRGAGGRARVLRINDGKDPDEFIKKNGKDAFDRLTVDAVPGIDFQLEILKQGLDLSDADQLLMYVEKAASLLKKVSPVEQDIYAVKIATECEISETAVLREIEVAGEERDYSDYTAYTNSSRNGFDTCRNSRKNMSSANERLDLSLLALTLRDTRYLDRMEKDAISMESDAGQRVRKAVSEIVISSNYPTEIDTEKLLASLDPEDEIKMRNILNTLIIGPDEDLFYDSCRTKYMQNRVKNERAELLHDLDIASKFDDGDEVAHILEKLAELDRQIKEEG